MQDRLFEYFKKIKNMVCFLAEGNEIETEEDYIVSLDNGLAKRKKAISLFEYNKYNELERYFSSEYQSMYRLICIINDGEYEKQVEAKSLPGTEKNQNCDSIFYEIILERLQRIFKDMYETIASQTRVDVEKYELSILDIQSQDEDEIFFDEDDKDEEDEEGKCYLVYNPKKDCFEGWEEENLVIEDIDVGLAMEFFAEYFVEKEREEQDGKNNVKDNDEEIR